MKQTNFLKKALLLVALVTGINTAWAENNPIEIPNAVGTYIPIGTASGTANLCSGITLNGNQVDNSNSSGGYYYTIGNNSSTSDYATFDVYAKETGDYIFNFKVGAGNGTGELELSLTNSSSKVIWSGTATVNQTRNSWDLGTGFYYKINISSTGNYQMKVKVKTKNSGDYVGNWGNFAFNKADAFYAASESWPTSSSKVDLTKGIYGGGCSGTENIGSIKNQACAEYILNNTSDNAKYLLHMGINYNNGGKINLIITDIDTGTEEVNQILDIPNPGDNYADFAFPITKSLSSGVKNVRFSFVRDDDNYLLNYKNVYFSTYTSLTSEYDSWPLASASTTYLDLSKWSTNGSPRYQSGDKNLGYIYHGNSACFYVNNENETAYYNLLAGITTNVSDANLVVTVTDVVTGNIEVNAEAFDVATGTSFATQTFKLSGAITAGLKIIHFDFTKDDTSTNPWLFNINNVTFFKRSLNEGYNFTPVDAENVDVVLTRSISANSWSTLCLPFTISATDLGTALGTTVTLAQYDSYDSGTNALTFTAESGDQTVTANKPCMIKVTSAVSGAKTINGVTLVSGDNYVTKDAMTFQGVYNSTKMAAGDFFVSGNKLYTATASTKNIKPFRGYFTTDTGTAKAPMLNIIEDGETTAIYAVNADGSLEPIADGKVYNLNGQRVVQPTRGLYIVNGKKVVIK